MRQDGRHRLHAFKDSALALWKSEHLVWELEVLAVVCGQLAWRAPAPF